MLSSNNILSPASGRPLAMPRLDMVTGLYFLTTEIPGDIGAHAPAGKDQPEVGVYSSPAEAIMAMDRGALSVRAPIRVRLTQQRPPAEVEAELFENGWQPGDAWVAETTLGRVLFNELLPHGYPFVNKQMHKKVQSAIINDLAERFPMIVVAQTVDKLKDAGFHWATRSGVTVSMADVLVPPQKAEILDRYEKEAERIEKQYQRGALNQQERRDALVKIWQEATDEVGKALEEHYPRAVPDDRGRADRRQAEGRRLPLGHAFGCHGFDGRRAGAAAEGGDPGPLREGSGADRKAVPAWCFEPAGASRRAGQDLAGGHRRGR
ncbi:DNA-directed RNA polymerase beta' chain [Mycobacteroides abscessus subsp. abscessus]|nr:DNA-directed RNA polymerase beta' chain [Mycobacteroides abscessus subsp. abscessus]